MGIVRFFLRSRGKFCPRRVSPTTSFSLPSDTPLFASFFQFEIAKTKLKLLPLDKSEAIFKSLRTFNLNDAKCFDPNEERKLKRIICHAGGEKRFTKQLQKFVNELEFEYNRKLNPSLKITRRRCIFTLRNSSPSPTGGKKVFPAGECVKDDNM